MHFTQSKSSSNRCRHYFSGQKNSNSFGRFLGESTAQQSAYPLRSIIHQGFNDNFCFPISPLHAYLFEVTKISPIWRVFYFWLAAFSRNFLILMHNAFTSYSTFLFIWSIFKSFFNFDMQCFHEFFSVVCKNFNNLQKKMFTSSAITAFYKKSTALST